MGKTIIALLPAIAAHIAWFLISLTSMRQELWFVVIVVLLIFGGILSARYLTGYLRNSNVDRNPVLMVFISIMIVILYVVIFFFTGCTFSVMMGN